MLSICSLPTRIQLKNPIAPSSDSIYQPSQARIIHANPQRSSTSTAHPLNAPPPPPHRRSSSLLRLEFHVAHSPIDPQPSRPFPPKTCNLTPPVSLLRHTDRAVTNTPFRYLDIRQATKTVPIHPNPLRSAPPRSRAGRTGPPRHLPAACAKAVAWRDAAVCMASAALCARMCHGGVVGAEENEVTISS